MAYLGTKPANQVIDSTLIADSTVTTSDLANQAVTTAKLSTGAPNWDTSGNVGIGTASPNQNGTGVTCHINSSTAGTWATTHYTNGSTGSAAADGLLVGTLGADGAYIFNYENTPMIFATNSAERMRINAGGDLQIGGTSASSSKVVVIRDSPSYFNAANLELLSYAGDVVMSFHAAGATAVCLDHVRGGGSVRCVNLSRTAFAPLEASAFAVGSDYRLKENITPLENATARVMQLPVYRFNFKSAEEVGMDYGDNTVDGFLAHEVAQVVPEAAFGEKDAVNEDGKPVYQSIDQSKLVPVLWAAIQELKAELDTVKAELATLKGTA